MDNLCVFCGCAAWYRPDYAQKYGTWAHFECRPRWQRARGRMEENMEPLTEEEIAALATTQAVLARLGVTQLVVDENGARFGVRRFFHGWRHGNGSSLVDALRNLPVLPEDESRKGYVLSEVLVWTAAVLLLVALVVSIAQ